MNLGSTQNLYDTSSYDLAMIPFYGRPNATGRSTMTREGSLGVWPSPQFGFLAQGYPNRDPRAYPALYGAHTHGEADRSFSSWEMLGPGAIGQERGQVYQPQLKNGGFSSHRHGPLKFGSRQPHDFASGHHNVVDVERIRRGLDVRTTVGPDQVSSWR